MRAGGRTSTARSGAVEFWPIRRPPTHPDRERDRAPPARVLGHPPGYGSSMAKPYSDALLADGPLLFVSGQTPEAPDGDVAFDITGQTRQIFRNLTEILERHGAGPGHLVKLTYYLRHITDLDEFRGALLACLPDGHLPAATLVEVSGLVNPRYLLEIDAVACLPREHG
ncbi:hypothetical protein BQ8420_25105 [Nocardiopsis sp. JB363]|nr:hypothetical protein BQ8420_25105 [Nocardiopsis sp. JB363]